MYGSFLDALISLKRVPRQGWVEKMHMDSPESVADHSFSVAAVSMLLADVAGLDAGRVVRMAILHDLAESATGDITPGGITAQEKGVLEDTALAYILQDVPEEQRKKYLGIIDEYRGADTPEARLLHQVDKLEMAVQADRYRLEGAGGGVEQFLETADRAITDPSMRKVFNMLSEDSTGHAGRERQPDRIAKAGDRDTL